MPSVYTWGCSSSSRWSSSDCENSPCWSAYASRYATRPNHRTWSGRLPAGWSVLQLGDPVTGFEVVLDLGEEGGGVGAVEGPVVPRQGEVADGVDGDRLAAVGLGDDDRAALHAIGGQDRHLRLVDDRHRQQRPE